MRLGITKTQTQKLIPLEIIKKNDLKLTRLNLIAQNVLWSRNVHRQQQPERIEIFIFSGLSLSRLVDTKLTLI